MDTRIISRRNKSIIARIYQWFSRLCCGLFAFVTPYLVMPDHIQSSMIGFAWIVLVATIAGIVMMRLQKKYGTSETRGTEDLQDTNVTA